MQPMKSHNKKRNGNKGQRNYIQGRKQAARDTNDGEENDYSRSLNSTRWKSWHNSIRDMDRIESGKEWKHRSGSNTSQHSTRHSHSHRTNLSNQPCYDIVVGYTGPSYSSVPSFHMDLTDSDCGHPTYCDHLSGPPSNPPPDQELDIFLNRVYHITDTLLATHATHAYAKSERLRQVATEEWLRTRSPSERAVYLQRQLASESINCHTDKQTIRS